MTAGEISLMTLFLILAPFVLVGLVWAMVLTAREMIVPSIKELTDTKGTNSAEAKRLRRCVWRIKEMGIFIIIAVIVAYALTKVVAEIGKCAIGFIAYKICDEAEDDKQGKESSYDRDD